ncbi:MAG TPA: hypothetical protein VJJ83_05435 [Candidatus Babeliales bacterium]|nr:hypothetical protein [Candidatus Babeliales bacterium]
MELLTVLEQRVQALMTLVQDLRTENLKLKADNQRLLEQAESLESVILRDKSEITQEKELTKLVVDGLIDSIDSLVEHKLN